MEKTYKHILDAFPFPIVYVDKEHIIRFLNKEAEFFYYQRRGYGDLVGKSIFECHNEHSKEKIMEVVEKLKNHSQEIFSLVNVRNQRIYVVPVRDDEGHFIGYFQRFEYNFQK